MLLTLEDLKREAVEELLKELSASERVKGLPPKELLAALSPEDRAALARLLKDYDAPAGGNAESDK